MNPRPSIKSLRQAFSRGKHAWYTLFVVFLLVMAGQGSGQVEPLPDDVAQVLGLRDGSWLALSESTRDSILGQVAKVFSHLPADHARILETFHPGAIQEPEPMLEDLFNEFDAHGGLNNLTPQASVDAMQSFAAGGLETAFGVTDSTRVVDETIVWGWPLISEQAQWLTQTVQDPTGFTGIGLDSMPLPTSLEEFIDVVTPSLPDDLQSPQNHPTSGLIPVPGGGDPYDFGGECVYRTLAGEAFCITYWIATIFVYLAVLIAVIIIAVFLAVAVAGIALAVFWANFILVKVDENADGVGDDWLSYWEKVADGTLTPAVDSDLDHLLNVDEFRWELYPVCEDSLPDDSSTILIDETGLSASNCKDFDKDNWMDGPEVTYWNNPENDGISLDGFAFLDPDRALDTNDDGEWNARDPDSDGDGLLDGDEVTVYDTYPEYADSDCAMFSAQCTMSGDTTYWDPARLGQPGSGDHINDADELAYWNAVGYAAWRTDYDEDGIWNNFLDPDSDNDGSLDGDEILAGTDPGDPSDGAGHTAAQADPTNQNLPEDLMDPTNLQYLRDGHSDATTKANETVVAVDQALSALIAGNVTQALNIIYEATPLAPLLPSPVGTVELAEEALMALIKCIDAQAASGDPQEAVTDTTQCARSVLLPFLEALLGRTVEQLPLVGDTVAQLRQETLPGIVDTVDRIAPLELQATAEALLDDPVGATQEAVLDAVDIVSNPENLEEAVTQSYAAAQVAAADLIPASSRHPQFLYDTILQGGLDEHWPKIQEQNDNVADATGVEPIAVVDSIAFNLYTNRGGDESITRVPVGERTCIQLSSTDTSTRDSDGCDLYATLTVSQAVASSPGGAPSLGKRITPSLQLETALPTATFELEALGYMQLADSPHVLVLGYATTGSGQPHTWAGTLLEYDANQAWTDRSIAYASSYDDDRAAIPLHLVAGSFMVEVSEPGKPVVEGEQTVLELESPGVPSSVSVDVRRLDAGGEHRVEASIDANAAATWDVLHFDGLGDHESRFHLAAADLPSGTSRVTQVTHGTTDASWQWTSPSALGALQATYREWLQDAPVRAFDANATDVPAAVLVRADSQAHTHAYQASAAPTTFTLLVGEGTDACPGLTDRFLVVEQGASTLCVVADLDGYTALQAQDLDTRFHVTGTRTTASTAGTTIMVRDGNTAYAGLPASPASWTGTFASNPGNLRSLDWSASQDLSTLNLQADLAGELLRVELTDAPTTVSATFDTARGRGELSASDYVGNLQWITSTTGTAPSAATLADHVRLLERPTGVEASWSIQDVQDVVARVTEDGVWEATGSFASPRPLEMYYEDESRRLQLEAASVLGDFQFRVEGDANTGLFSYSHDLAAPTSSVTLAGVFGGKNVRVAATSVPADVSLVARLDAQSVALDASGTVGSLEAVYAPDGRHPTSAASSFVIVGGTAAARPGLHVKLADVSQLDVTRSPATLTLDSTTTASNPLLLRFEQQQSATVLDLDAMPGQATVANGEGAMTWSSNSPSTSFEYLARGASASSYLAATATDAPGSLTVSWTPRAVDTFQAFLSHDAASLPSLVVEDHRTVGGQTAGEAGFRFEGIDLPSQVVARFEPTQGRLTATATTAGGAPAVAGFLDLGFGERRPTRLQAPVASGTLVFLDETDARIAGALRASGLESLTVRLFGDEAQPDSAGTVDVQRVSDGAVYVRADSTSRDAHGIIHYATAPAVVEALLWPGTGAGGFRVESHSAADAGALTAELVRDGRSLTATTAFPTPADLVASWVPGAAVQVVASSPAVVRVQATPQGVDVPGHSSWDHVVVQQDTAGSVFGLHLTSVESFTLDPAQGFLDADVGGGVPLLVDHAPGAERLRLHADPLPAELVASWSPATYNIEVDGSAAMTKFLVSTDPGDAGGRRLLGILDGVPSGVTTFTASPSGAFTLDAPLALTRARVTSDTGTGAASTLDGDGVRVQAGEEQPSFFLNVPSVQRMELLLPAAGTPRLELSRGPTSGVPAEIRLGLPGQRLMGNLDAFPGGSTVLSWPSAASMEFLATGVLGRDVTLGYDVGSERGEVGLTNGPGVWSLGFTEAGAIDYAASGGATGLDAFGAWHGAAFALDADGVPSSLGVVSASGMQSGSVTATGGDVGRLRLALASSGGSGSAAVPSVDSSGRDVFAVDTTSGGGLLSVDLPDVESVAWVLPDSVGRVTGTPLAVDLQRSAATTQPAVVLAVLAAHLSFASFPDGLPASLGVDLIRSTAKWVLGADSAGKDYTFQHQASDAGSLRVESVGAPASSTVSVEPKATRALDYAASGGASRLVVQSRWNGGYVDADLTDAPSKFRVDSGGVTLQDGTVSTLASGSVGRAEFLVVPNGKDSANRVNPRWEHLAVETTGKTPYMGLNLAGFTSASWQLPEATGNRPVVGSIERTFGVPGNMWVVLSGPREDVTVKAVDAGPVVSLSVVPSTNTGGNLNPQPLSMDYDGSASRVSVAHMHAESGQVASADFTGLTGGATVQATGVEPSFVDVTVGGATDYEFQTTDGGTTLHMAVEDATPRLRATVTRGSDCGASSGDSFWASTMGTGRTGSALVQIGDEGKVPLDNGGTYVSFLCSGGEASAGLQAPFVDEAGVANEECDGTQAKIPVTSSETTSFTFGDTRGTYEVGVRGQSGEGVMDLVLDCKELGYDTPGVSKLATLHFGSTRHAVSNATGDCIQIKETCINRIVVDGTGVASQVNATFSGTGGRSGFRLKGGDSSDVLDVQLVMEKSTDSSGSGEEKRIDMEISSTMPVGKLWFQKSDRELQKNRPEPNIILHIDNHEEDTVLVKLEKLVSAHVQLDTTDGFELKANYDGNSNKALLFNSEKSKEDKVDTKEHMVRLSDLPNGMNLHVRVPDLKKDGGEECGGSGEKKSKNQDIRVNATLSNSIPSLEYAYESKKEDCSGEVSEMSFKADAKAIPAGDLTIRSFTTGKAGILQVQSSGGTIHSAFVEYTKDDAAVLQAKLTNVWLHVEWDLDGDFRYEGSPRFVFLDTSDVWVGIKYFRVHAKEKVFILRGTISAGDFQIKNEFDPVGLFVGAATGAFIGSTFGPWGAAGGALVGGAIDAAFKVSGSMCASAVASAGIEWKDGPIGLGLPIFDCKAGELL